MDSRVTRGFFLKGDLVGDLVGDNLPGDLEDSLGHSLGDHLRDVVGDLEEDLVGDLEDSLKNFLGDSCEQRIPPIVAWRMTPPSSAIGVEPEWLKSSSEASQDVGSGLKRSGVPEETEGEVCGSVGGVLSWLDTD